MRSSSGPRPTSLPRRSHRRLRLVAAASLGSLALTVSTPASSADPDPTASADGTGRRCQPFADMVPTELGSFGGATMPSDINDRGQVVGVSFTPAGQTHAFLWESGVLTDLTPSLDAAQDPDINERGQVLIHGYGPEGSRTLLWHRGTSVELTGLDDSGDYQLRPLGRPALHTV